MGIFDEEPVFWIPSHVSYCINPLIVLKVLFLSIQHLDTSCKVQVFPSFSGLDFLPQLNLVFPPRKTPVAVGSSVLHSSPLNVFMGSPGREENENHDLTAESKKTYLGKQEPKDSFKQVSAWKWYWAHCVCWSLESKQLPVDMSSLVTVVIILMSLLITKEYFWNLSLDMLKVTAAVNLYRFFKILDMSV